MHIPGKELQRKQLFQLNSQQGLVWYSPHYTHTLDEVVWEQSLALLREGQERGELRREGPLLTAGTSGFGWGQSNPQELE